MNTPAKPSHAGAVLTVDLGALAANWKAHKDRLSPGADCAAVVKADAYGVGLAQVAPALWNAGCRHFFVALLNEGLRLRDLLPDAVIHVLNGLIPEEAELYREKRLIPVLDTLEEIASWKAHAETYGAPLPADIHLDTAMARLGLPPADIETLVAAPQCLDGIDLRYVVSHLACAEEPDNPLNARQLAAFRDGLDRLRQVAGPVKASFANSSGLFLGSDYHFDLPRAGASLYGVNPQPGTPNPMAQVVRLQGKILQVREIDTGWSVGYGATWRAERPSRIATVAAGYGDGYPRSLSNAGFACVGETLVPVVGRISMDLTTFDVTDVPEGLAVPGAYVDLIGPRYTVDDVAAAAGTIGYEILTNLGPRYARLYVGGEA